MKRGVLSFSLTLSFIFVIFTGCSSEPDGRINMPSQSRNYEGTHFQTVVDELQGAGFTNVSTEALEDLITGWTKDDGEVEKVTVDGSITSFSTDSKYAPDVSIVVTYHTFPSDSSPSEAVESGSSSEQVQPATDESTDILTIENYPELESMLASIDFNDFVSFADKYKGQAIAFDGCITYLVNHDDYDTRYDILLSGGDYIDEETANPGPTFKFDDVNTFEMGIQDLSLPSFVAVGNNVCIIAEVVGFDANTGIFELKPITVTER